MAANQVKIVFGLLIASYPACLETYAQAEATAKSKADSKVVQGWMAYYGKSALKYDIRLKSKPDQKLKPSPKAIYRFDYVSHAAKPHGAFFVWTHNGRPEAICAIWSRLVGAERRRVAHDLHSLSLEPLTAKFEEVTWRPETAGVEFIDVPDADPPSRSSGLRLAQMRSIARNFRGYVTRQKKVPLRVHGQPLYRYDVNSTSVLDGAIFCLFDEWDPEILLLIEARGKEQKRWRFSPVRCSEAQLDLEFQTASIWNDGPKGFSDPTKTFYAPRVAILENASVMAATSTD